MDRLSAYHFYEESWASYDELYRAFSWECPDTFNMAEYTCDRWAKRDDRVALYAADEEGRDERWSFRELRKEADRLANYLRHRGIERDDRVAIISPQRPETLVAHLATWKLGAISVPMSILFGPDALRHRLNSSGALACIVDARSLPGLRKVVTSTDLETILAIDAEAGADGETTYTSALEQSSPDLETVTTDPEEPALITYTSGTTGQPKGAVQVQRLLLGALPIFMLSSCNVSLEEEAVFWAPAEWAWVGTLFTIVFPALFFGRPVVAYDAHGFDPEGAFRVIEQYDVTNFHAPPTALRMMTKADVADQYDVSAMRTISSGGEALGQALRDRLQTAFGGVPINERYGQTEADGVIGQCEALMETPDASIGRPAPGHEIDIVDPDTATPVSEPDDVGEIAVRYEGNLICFDRYWNDPGQTATKVRNGYLLSEDLGRQDENGFFYFRSRKDDVIISAGYRIGPEEIEDTLATHDAVADCAVVGIPDQERGEVPKAYVKLSPEGKPTQDLIEELQAYTKERLARYEYPREIEFVDELPTTVTGKVKRSALGE